MIYHLPNAGSWVQAHTLWIADTTYWWYPPGSEMMAAVYLATCGSYAIPIVGVAALFALTCVVYEAAFTASQHRLYSTALALALGTSHVVAVQGGDLQNDVLQAALFVACTSMGRPQERRGALQLLALAFVKPSGWVYAVLASLNARSRRTTAFLSVIVVMACLWARNLLLARSAPLALPRAPNAGVLGSSIAAHGINGVTTLAQSAVNDGFTTALLVACAFLSVGGVTRSRYARAAATALLLWVISPYSFESAHRAQLALGWSLRFGLPAMACAGIYITEAVAGIRSGRYRVMKIASILLMLVSLLNLIKFRAVFAVITDANFMPWAALIVLVAGTLSLRFLSSRMQLNVALACTAFALLNVAFAARLRVNMISFYTSVFRQSDPPTSLAATISSTREPALGAAHFASGIIAMLRPDLKLFDVSTDGDLCQASIKLGAPVLVHKFAVSTQSPACEFIRKNQDDFVITPKYAKHI